MNICFFFILLFICRFLFKIDFPFNQIPFIKLKEPNAFEKYEVYKYIEIRKKLSKYRCLNMQGNQKEFLNGVIRYFKP